MSLSKERQALLKQKSDHYIASMETPGNGVAYSRVATDKLLILEALNDWSGRLLAEGGDIKLNFGCDDPACASRFELCELLKRMHAAPVIASLTFVTNPHFALYLMLRHRAWAC